MLNEIGKELARRGHKFVCYADDCMMLVRSKRAAKRVRESIATFIESQLHLKVNRDKTEVAYVGRVKPLRTLGAVLFHILEAFPHPACFYLLSALPLCALSTRPAALSVTRKEAA